MASIGVVFLDFTFGNSGILTQKSLDFLWEKQKVVANNIANNDTPGYKAKYVTFEEELRTKLASGTDKKRSQMKEDIMNSKIRFHTTQNESNRLDGNNVNVDVESMEMARTTLHYQYMLKAFNNDYSRLRTIIRGQ